MLAHTSCSAVILRLGWSPFPSEAAGTGCTNSPEINTYAGRYVHVLKALRLLILSTQKQKKALLQPPRNEHFQSRLAGGGLE